MALGTLPNLGLEKSNDSNQEDGAKGTGKTHTHLDVRRKTFQGDPNELLKTVSK
jgi:hypothetical protein